MFASLSRFRRQIAVLAALAMLASVLVAAPAVAADPAPDYTATFDACIDVPGSGFEDVPSGHANAGDIDCIAYYGITKGTSATTYSPLMSVTREHMALFLTRLAGLVGIEIASNPADPRFTDTGDLSMESQVAIAQLADLGITKGTSATTYSPADSVTRGQMALFISRLMDLMDPMSDGDGDNGAEGFIPKDVKVTDDTPVGSPFTDLGSATKSAYDAITALYELGVASGISDTAYGPSALITRASMADFMAGVLDHSNARPAGISISAAKTSDFGPYSPKIVTSYRDDNFVPMVDVSIKIFESALVSDFTEDGTCGDPADCAWSDDDVLTDDSGNIHQLGNVENGMSNTYYAWMGDEDTTDFDADDADYASVTLSSTKDAAAIKVTTDINEEASDDKVNLDKDSSVIVTVQLIDGDGGENVAKSGVKIGVKLTQEPEGEDMLTVYPAPADLETDDDGQATFTITGPPSEGTDNDDDDRTDVATFTVDFDDDGNTTDAGESVDATVEWTDADSALARGEGSAPAYVILNSKDEASIRASVTFYDQYGNTTARGHTVSIGIGKADAERRTVSSRGVASYRATSAGTVGDDITVTYSGVQDSDENSVSVPITGGTAVTAVRHAPDDDSAAAAKIDAVYADENRFRIRGLLYTYDADDTFVDDTMADKSVMVDMAKFESLIAPGDSDTAGTVQVVSYDDDGSSIFRVTAAGS